MTIPREGIEVTGRFYLAIDFLISEKKLRGRQTFCKKYDIDKRTFYLIQREPEINTLRVLWLVYLTRDYAVSARWLLTGEGKMIRKKRIVNILKVPKRTTQLKIS